MTITNTFHQGKFLNAKQCIDNHLKSVNADEEFVGLILTATELVQFELGKYNGAITTPINETAEVCACHLEEEALACIGTTLVLNAEQFEDLQVSAQFYRNSDEEPVYAIVPLMSTREFYDESRIKERDQRLADLFHAKLLSDAQSLEAYYSNFSARCAKSGECPEDVLRQQIQHILEMDWSTLSDVERFFIASVCKLLG